MNEEHFTKFGALASPQGSLYLWNVGDTKDIREASSNATRRFWVDVYKDFLKTQGIAITSAVERIIEDFCQKKQDEFDRETTAKGVPQKLKTLFAFTRKADAVKYCKKLELDDEDFFLLVCNSHQIGFTHQFKAREFVPLHLQVSQDDISEMKKGTPKKFVRKVSSVFLERRRIYVHLFESGTQWHCFYFTERG